MGNMKAWVFRILVLAAGGAWLYAWLSPWWTVEILQLGPDIAVIRPWGLELANVPKQYMSLVRNAPMPEFFAPLMWAYLAFTVVALLYAVIFKDREIKLFGKKFSLNGLAVAGVGFSIVVFAVCFVVIASARAAEFWETPLQGTYFIKMSESEYSDAVSKLLPGFWVACVAGPVLLVLGLLRSRIIGKPVSAP